MKSFQFKSPAKIIYGTGESEKLASLAESMGLKNLFLLTGKHVSQTKGFQGITKNLDENGILYTVYADTVPEPDVNLADKIAGILRESSYDCVIAVGGGSVLDIGKAVSMLKNNPGSAREYMFGGGRTVTNKALPLICIPTTAGSGSEVTASSVLTDNENHVKASITSDAIIPLIALIDPVMQEEMPKSVAASTGLDALTHGIESYVSKHSNPMSDMYATTAIGLIAENIRTAVFEPADTKAKGKMALASTLAAVAFMNGGLGVVHGISQSMGGIAHVSHGVGNAMLLPYIMKVNRKGNQKKFAKIAELVGEKTDGLSTYEAAMKAVEWVRQLAIDLEIPASLKEVGVEKNMFDEIIQATMEYRLLWQNPVPVYENTVRKILEEAYE